MLVLAEPVHFLEEGLSLHLNWLCHCLTHAQHYLHALVLQIQTGDIGPQRHVHALLHQHARPLQLANVENGAVEDVVVVDVGLELQLLPICCLHRPLAVLHARSKHKQGVPALALGKNRLNDVSKFVTDALPHLLHLRTRHTALQHIINVELKGVSFVRSVPALLLEQTHSELRVLFVK